MERWHPEASLVHISSARGTPKGHHVPSMLRPDDGGVVCKWEPSLVCSCYVGNHNARLTRGARRPGPDSADKDQLHYGDSDPDNHGRHPRIQDAQRSPSPDACGPQAFVKRFRQTPFLVHFRVPPNIVKYSRDSNPAVWLEDF